MFDVLKSYFDRWRERRRKRLRLRIYGLGLLGDHVAILLSWVLAAVIIGMLDARGVTAPYWLLFVLFLGPIPFWFWFHWWLGKRQRKLDAANALAAISRSLRSRREPDGNYVDFDPDFVALQPNGTYVWALDRRRRLMRFIMADTKNGDYVWPFDIPVVEAELIDVPARRRLFGLLAPRRDASPLYLNLVVTAVGRDGSKTVRDLPFRCEERGVAKKWREVLLEWARDAAAVKASNR